MPVSFLAPAFALGLAAAAIPLWVHLARRAEDRTVEFPSLMFLERIEHRATRRRRIRHWALLAARVLVVVLVAAAFARPFLAGEAGAAAGDGAPREIALLVDRSYSMAYGDRWERATAEAVRRLGGVGPRDRVTLVLFDEDAEARLRSTSDVGAVRAALEGTAPGSGTTRYAPALELAAGIVAGSRLPRKELVLVSDLQAGGWSPGEGGRLPSGVAFEVAGVGGEEPAPNTGVVSVTLHREARSGEGSGDRVEVTARLRRRGGREPRTVPAVLEIDGREVARVEARLEGEDVAEVAFPPFVVAEEETRGTVRLAGDRLPTDDVFHFVVSPAPPRPVLVVDGREAGSSSLYVRRALEVSDDPGYAVDVRRAGALARVDLDDVELVVLNAAPWPGGAAGRRLRSWAESGGGVLVALGRRGTLGGSGTGLSAGTVRDAPAGGALRLGDVAYEHPVFEPFREAGTGDFTAARVFRTRTLAGIDSSMAIVARFDDGSPALVEVPAGDGRIAVWTSTLDALWSDLPLQPVFVPFVHRLALHLAGSAGGPPWWTVGDLVDLSAGGVGGGPAHGEPGHEHEECIARTPSGDEMALPSGGGGRVVELGERGFYEFRTEGEEDGGEPARTVAVNVDPAESLLDPLDPRELTAALAPRPDAAQPAEEARSSPDGEGGDRAREEERERRQGLWRWLVAGAFLLLVVETAWSNRTRYGT